MVDLKTEQAAVFTMMRMHDARGFLRICQADDALWVSDCIRREPLSSGLVEDFCREGIRIWTDENVGLLYLDWTEEKWKRIMLALPDRIPLFPKQEMLHEAYALCRLLLLHPHEYPALREARIMLKMTAGPEEVLLRTISEIHQRAAQAIRQGKPAGCEAGRILAAWIREKEKEK